MKKKFIVSLTILLIIFYFVRIELVNSKYHGMIVTEFSEDELICLDDISINILDFKICQSYETLCNTQNNTELNYNENMLFYPVLTLELKNITNSKSEFDLLDIMLYNECWSEFVDMSNVGLMNDFLDSPVVELDAGEKCIVTLPFAYHKAFGNNMDDILENVFFLHIELEYPHLNEEFIIELNDYLLC